MRLFIRGATALVWWVIAIICVIWLLSGGLFVAKFCWFMLGYGRFRGVASFGRRRTTESWLLIRLRSWGRSPRWLIVLTHLLCLQLLLCGLRNKFEDAESMSHLVEDLLFSGCVSTSPCSEFKLTDEGSLYRLESQAKFDQTLELRGKWAYFRV